ncbi:hypothetical protein [Labrenzia sp. OB1]|uniref:hypothetical protein n=1 Tax=Labrenzia sp. OB1 TaxID=1561204 RepID=UPI0007B26CD5|nr:hypothetical protein [Labrenzia sp. OB1]KZM47360.1 hypothetical protein OA90_26425 [Labrenzia sp. OB1]
MESEAIDRKLTARQRDYLLLTVFVLARHHYIDRALTLVEGLLALGEDDEDILFAQVILNFLQGECSDALSGLDKLMQRDANATSAGRPQEKQVVQLYLRARCYCATGRRHEGEAIARRLTSYHTKEPA